MCFQILVDSGQSISYRLEQLSKLLYSIEDKVRAAAHMLVTFHPWRLSLTDREKTLLLSLFRPKVLFSRPSAMMEATGNLSYRLFLLRCFPFSFSFFFFLKLNFNDAKKQDKTYAGLWFYLIWFFLDWQVKQESLGISTKMFLKVDVESGKLFFKKSKDGPEDKYFVHNKSKTFPVYYPVE